jgi:hypothetical protein
MRKERRVIFLLSLSLLLILFGCGKKDDNNTTNTQDNNRVGSLAVGNQNTNQTVELNTNGLSTEEVQTLAQSPMYKSLLAKQKICDERAAEQKEQCFKELELMQFLILDKSENCGRLADEYKDRCFENLALEKKDLKLCDSISDNNIKNACKISLVKAQAVEQKNISLCDGITDKIEKINCQEEVISQQDKIEFCDENYIKQNKITQTCQSIIWAKKAYQEVNLGYCQKIPLADNKDICLQEVNNMLLHLDSDNDGLTDKEETEVYRTNPKNPDTDGDGYKDGDEVRNGYNPLGPGKGVKKFK